MNRRRFLALSAAAGVGHFLHAQQCRQIAPGVMGCRAEIAFPTVALAATLQNCPEWCWAASISMVFKFFGHVVSQERIVRETYGQLVCWPAFQYQIMAANLNKCWTDDSGRKFRANLTAAYDAQAGVNAMNNAIIVNELLQQRPILYANTHHAMVICAVDYRPSTVGPLIDAVYVMDPWPPSPRIHALSQPEIVPIQVGGQMVFLASTIVSSC